MIRRSDVGSICEIIRISHPIKSHWAQAKGLDLQQLLGDGPYKELYRKEMIVWSDEVRAETPEFFCREAFAKGEHISICRSSFGF